MDDDSSLSEAIAVRGRGTGSLAKSRFERLQVARAMEDGKQVETEVFHDTSRSILTTNDSPDIGFGISLNPYRGCEHGCIYCYARPFHEYLGLSAGLDFETKIFAKPQAAELLERELSSKKWMPQVIAMSGVTDCYQPIERKLAITRKCLEVLVRFMNPAVIITKNHLVTRDKDLLAQLAARNAARVVISITTLDGQLARLMEPRASRPDRRFMAVEELSKAGIPVCVNIAPIIPGLTDHEIPALLKRAAEAGAISAHYTMLRLPYGVKDLFSDWLAQHYPLREQKVLNRIRAVRGGRLYSAEFGERMRGSGIFAEQVAQMFAQYRSLYKLDRKSEPLSVAHFRRTPDQLSFF